MKEKNTIQLPARLTEMIIAEEKKAEAEINATAQAIREKYINTTSNMVQGFLSTVDVPEGANYTLSDSRTELIQND